MASLNQQQLYLGLDVSTQSTKAVIIDTQHRVLHTSVIKYSTDLPHYNTQDGVNMGDKTLVFDEQRHGKNKTVTTPTLMMVEALDMLFGKLPAGMLQQVVGISLSAQQHGSVWLNDKAKAALQSLKPSQTLAEQLGSVFSIANGPIWMDSSTTEQCEQITQKLGGAKQLAQVTGSKAYERFTLNQILKVRQYAKDNLYKSTAHVQLISNFITSLLCGKLTPIDYADGSGMNAMDLQKAKWNSDLVDEELQHRLGGELIASNTVVGSISDYFVQRYKLSPQCKIVAGSGDNLCAAVGLGLSHNNDTGISLGSSDTLFATVSLDQIKPNPNYGCIFRHTLKADDALIMNVYSNGSIVRQKLRDTLCEGSGWDEFNAALSDKSIQHNYLTVCWLHSEITPTITQSNSIFVYDVSGADNDSVKLVGCYETFQEMRQRSGRADAELICSLIDGQMVRLYNHATELGLHNISRIVATGGAAANTAILQVLADAFQATVYTCSDVEMAAYGAALRAADALQQSSAGASNGNGNGSSAIEMKAVCQPDSAKRDVYQRLASLYKQCEGDATARLSAR